MISKISSLRAVRLSASGGKSCQRQISLWLTIQNRLWIATVGPRLGRGPAFLQIILMIAGGGMASLAMTVQPVFAAEQLIPNDPGFVQQWYLQKIHAPEVWSEGKTLRSSLGQGSADVLVAVIDSGVDVNHPDLQENIWTNPGEVPGNGIDDDRDGFVDDVHGWDFLTNTPDPRPKLENAQDLQDAPLAVHHGTILAGIIGAVGNNQQGITGVNWRVSILPIRAIHSDGTGDAATVARAMQFAIDHGVNIINFSFVGEHNTPELQQVIERAFTNDILLVAAAGNEMQQDGATVVRDLDSKLLYPICTDASSAINKVIGVTATNRDDIKSSFATIGSRCIDVTAPGEQIFSTRSSDPQFGPVRPYGAVNGTSMSTAVVSGAAALLKAIVPNATLRSIGQSLIDGSDSIDSINSSFRGRIGKGRINILTSLHLLQERHVDTVPPVSPLAVTSVPAEAVSPTLIAAWPSPTTVGTNVVLQTRGQPDQHLFLKTPWNTQPSLAVLSDGRIVLGAPVGSPAQVQIYSPMGILESQFTAYPNYRGGVWVETVVESGVTRIVTLPRTRAGSHLRVFTPTGALVRQFFVTNPRDRNNWIMGPVAGSIAPQVVIGSSLDTLAIVDVSLKMRTPLPTIKTINEPITSIALLQVGQTHLIALGSAKTSRVWVGAIGSPLHSWYAYPKGFALPVIVAWQRSGVDDWNVITVPGRGSVQLRVWKLTGGLQSQAVVSSPFVRTGGQVRSVVLR